MLRSVMVGALMLLLIGCGSSATEKLGGDGPAEPWPALDSLQDADGIMGAAYAAERKDWTAVRNHVATPGFKSLVEEFKSAAVPSGYSKQASAKSAAEEKLDALISAAEGNAGAGEIQAAWDAAYSAVKQLRGNEGG